MARNPIVPPFLLSFIIFLTYEQLPKLIALSSVFQTFFLFPFPCQISTLFCTKALFRPHWSYVMTSLLTTKRARIENTDQGSQKVWIAHPDAAVLVVVRFASLSPCRASVSVPISLSESAEVASNPLNSPGDLEPSILSQNISPDFFISPRSTQSSLLSQSYRFSKLRKIEWRKKKKTRQHISGTAERVCWT